MQSSRIRLSSLLLLAVLACQRQPTTQVTRTDADADTTALARSFCETLHAQAAQRKAECCQRPSERLYLEECVRFTTSSLNAKAIRVDPAKLTKCAGSLQRAVTGCDWITPGQPALPAECRELVQGQLGTGEVCRSSLECRAPLHCEGNGLTGTGKCVPPGELGAACGARVDALATYTGSNDPETSRPSCAEHCSLVTHRCEARPVPGSSCFASVNCAKGQSCVEGSCREVAVAERALSAPGEACATDLDCVLGGCSVQADGVRRCGMKCSAALAELREPGATPLQLPLVPRRASKR